MPAHKRSLSENRDDEDPIQYHQAKQPRHEAEPEEEEAEKEDQKEQQQQQGEEEVEEQDSEDSPTPSTGSDEKPEFISVELSEIRKDVQCPICLGIIKKTRIVMECLHRFCRECIDKSMRLGNNECPTCRTHCASRRSLRDDPNYDALIAALYPDIDKYEEQELAFHEEERNRNKQIQAAIAQISQRQTEALVRRRALGKETAGAFMTRSLHNHCNTHSRRRRNCEGTELERYKDNEDENGNNGGKDSSSTNEHCAEFWQQRYNKRRPRTRSPQPSISAANSDGGCRENDLDARKESRRISPGLVWNPELLAWGGGGARSHTRHGISIRSNNKNSRSNRISKLVGYLRSLEEKRDELDVHIMLISLDTKSTQSLQLPYLCCRPNLSLKHLYEYIACQTPLHAEDVEILVVKGQHTTYNDKVPQLENPSNAELQNLEGQETLAHLKANCIPDRDHLILAYRQKAR